MHLLSGLMLITRARISTVNLVLIALKLCPVFFTLSSIFVIVYYFLTDWYWYTCRDYRINVSPKTCYKTHYYTSFRKTSRLLLKTKLPVSLANDTELQKPYMPVQFVLPYSFLFDLANSIFRLKQAHFRKLIANY